MWNRRTFLAIGALGTLAGCGSKAPAYSGPPVTRVQVMKGKRRMYLLSDTTLLKAYDIRLGGNPVGPKQFEGDGKTPEGAYFINRRNPNSAYHLSLGISYPDRGDVDLATAAGRRPGGDIFIHGTPRDKSGKADWTAGCIAVSDREMDEIYAMVNTGTLITIYP